MNRVKWRSRVLSRICRKVAPTPSATEATLCVASATPKGKPRKISTGNCSNPAPPPEKAENKFAISDTKKSSS
jgi:hypothetical protein